MAEPLPNFRASLSKYIRLEDHYRILAGIQYDIRETKVRRTFGDDLFVTAKARYLITANGYVIRDRLIDLVHEEGELNQVIRMVMYFSFMFRDPRYRNFICDVLGRENGKWNTSVFKTTHHTAYFAKTGGHKAFTNLRQYLFQIGVLNERSYEPHFPELNTWFPAAVEIASQTIANAEARHNFLTNPTSFITKYKINALLNATPKELTTAIGGGAYEEDENLLPVIVTCPP